MTASSIAICGFQEVPGSHGSSTSHPVIVPDFTQPFTLLQDNGYTLRFFNRLNAAARVYAKGFVASSSAPLWWGSVSVPNEQPGQAQYVFFRFSSADLRGSTSLWMGSWWDDGTYPGTEAGTVAYFTDHPDSPGHHTVPILVG